MENQHLLAGPLLLDLLRGLGHNPITVHVFFGSALRPPAKAPPAKAPPAKAFLNFVEKKEGKGYPEQRLEHLL